MGLALEFTDGQTPIDEDEKEGLKIPSISMHGELNEFEQLNIQKAIEWTLSRKFTAEKILSEKFVKELHKRMYDDVWKWAGTFRKSNKNIGVDWIDIGVSLKQLLDDCRYWIEHKTYPPDEIAIQFKHRLVSIHCFPNGNGRHSRLFADILVSKILNQDIFTWGAADIQRTDDIRKEYLAVVKEADKGNINPLLKFARK